MMAFAGIPRSKLKGQANPIVILVAVIWTIATIGVSLGSFLRSLPLSSFSIFY